VAGYTLSVELVGPSKESGEVRFVDFLSVLQSFQSAIVQADLAVSNRHSVYPRLIDLRHQSPATVTVELHQMPRPRGSSTAPLIARLLEDRRVRILDQIFKAVENLNDINAETFGRGLLEAIRDMASPVAKQRIAHARVYSNGRSVDLTPTVHARLQELLLPEQSAEGTADGTLEAINLHSTPKAFNIYPLVGPSKLVCHFPTELEDEAIAAIRKRVLVTGLLKYHEGATYPHAIEVQSLSVFPPNDALPTFSELRGIAPDATGDMLSEDFIRQIRNAWG
jgi:hypothetical protein